MSARNASPKFGPVSVRFVAPKAPLTPAEKTARDNSLRVVGSLAARPSDVLGKPFGAVRPFSNDVLDYEGE